MNKNDRAYYIKKFKKFPDVVELEDFCTMLRGIFDKYARKLVQEKQVKSFLIAAQYVNR